MDARTIVAVDIGGTKIACGLVVMGESARPSRASSRFPPMPLRAAPPCSRA